MCLTVPDNTHMQQTCSPLPIGLSLLVCFLAPARLDALLSALSQAKGSGLLNPWAIIHPDNSVSSLAAALDPALDEFYHELPKFKFLDCLDHYATGDGKQGSGKPTTQIIFCRRHF